MPVTTWQHLLKYQHLNLASHHLYGSSRLGTKDYMEEQLYARVDLTGSQPFMDTLMLTARRPWYSIDYDELITGASQTPWGMAATEPYHFAAQIGQKQYELSNHLGNVQATVSDLPYMATFTQANTDVHGVKYEPSLRSAYDYYPFGMLMPGRYVSDTTERCMTISRTGWSTILVDSCRPLYTATATFFASGGGTANYTNGNLVLSAPLAGDAVSIAMQVASGVENTFEFDVNQIAGAAEEGVLVSVLETIDNVPYVIGGGRLQLGGKQKINFRSFGNHVSLLFTGPLDVMEIAKVCTKYPKSVQHTYLVDVCDESKDRYRFGFNGQEKVNEIAGVGNHIDFKFRGYDPRTGRFWSTDPVQGDYPWNSVYAFAENSPIQGIDLEGLELLKVNSAIYLRKYEGTFTYSGKANHYYNVKIVDKNKPSSIIDKKGNWVYDLGAPVGAYGSDKAGAYFRAGKAQPDFKGKGSDAKSTRGMTRLSPNVVPGRSATPANTVAPGASTAQHLGNMASNWLNQGEWKGISKEQGDRRSFYTATNIVNAVMPDKSDNGKLKADLVNFITDGTLPELNSDNMKGSLTERKEIMEHGMQIMKKNKIEVQPETQKTYQSTVNSLQQYESKSN